MQFPPDIDRPPGRRDCSRPGFIDVQVNGGGGVLFNDTPTVEGIRAIGAAHRKFGTTGFLPTLITDTREKMAAAVEAVREASPRACRACSAFTWRARSSIPERKGVHDPQYMRPIEDEDIRIMTSLGSAGRTAGDARAGDGADAMRSCGLAEAGCARLRRAYRGRATRRSRRRATAGCVGYTHLFNAMPPLMGREPGPVGAALSTTTMHGVSLIVDLHHVSSAARCALRSRRSRPERAMLITDAMPPSGSDLTSFELQGRTIFRQDGRLTTADGTLAGSDLDMATAVRNADRFLDVGILRRRSRWPRSSRPSSSAWRIGSAGSRRATVRTSCCSTTSSTCAPPGSMASRRRSELGVRSRVCIAPYGAGVSRHA